MRARALALLVTSALITSALAPLAVDAQGSPRIELGAGLWVERCTPPPSPWEPPQCWQPHGFSFGAYGTLRYARSFVRTRSGRVVAAIPDNVSQLQAGRMAPVVYTDDLGASWHEAYWDPPVGSGPLGAFSPLALSADPASDRVIAVGEYARLWVSVDGGASFVQRRSGGQTYVGVEVLGRAIVITDADGRVWLSDDDGFSLSTLSRERSATVTREEDAIVVRAGRAVIRVDARGTPHRASR